MNTTLSITNSFNALFAKAGANALDAATLVAKRLREFPDTAVDQEQLKAIEREGDHLTAKIFEQLSSGSETPFDREYIYGLASALDDIVDHIENASDLLELYKVEAPTDQAIAQTEVLVKATTSLATVLENLRETEQIEQHLAAIKRYEDEGDQIVRDAIAALFEDDEIDPRVIIRWKDIFEAFEEALDACDTAAHVIGNIVARASSE